MSPPWKTELPTLVRLSLPVVTIQVGTMMMGFLDTLMVGRFAEDHLAAAGLAHFYTFVAMMFGVGVLMSLDPVLSQAEGARDTGAVTRNFQRGVVMSIGLSVPVSFVYLFSTQLLMAVGQEAELAELAGNYIRMQIPSVLPFYFFNLLRTTLQAKHGTAPIVWTIVIANVLNAFLNYVLIFGEYGFEAMGLQGSAIATLISRWVMFLVLLWLGARSIRPHVEKWTRAAIDSKALYRLLRVGAPIGVQILLEFGAFGFTLLMMGRIDSSALAGHQIAITLASMSYMFPLGISVATGVRVGHGVGRSDSEGARWAAGLGLGLGALVMVGFAVVFLVYPETLVDWFTRGEDSGAAAVCLTLLPIAAVFQVVDGLQVVALGILRGVTDTKVPMLVNLFGFWGVGIPTGLLLAFHWDWGPEGLWWGLTAGLTVVSVCLLWRVWRRLARDLDRVEIDEPSG